MLRAMIAAGVAAVVAVGSTATAAEIPFEALLAVAPPDPRGPSFVTPLVMDPPFDSTLGTLTGVSFTISFGGGVRFTFPEAGPYGLGASVEASLLSGEGDVLDTVAWPIEAFDGTIDGPRISSLADSLFLRFATSDVSAILSGEPLSLHLTVSLVQYAGVPIEDVAYFYRVGAFEQNGRYVYSPAVPEPTAALLYGGGVALVAAARRRRWAPAGAEAQRELPRTRAST